MKILTFDINQHQYSSTNGEMHKLTICGINNEEVILELNDKQVALMESRSTRSFYKRCKKEHILNAIWNAVNYKELEEIANKYFLCDICRLNGINFVGLKRVMKAVVEILYKYPKLRSKLCYIGTHQEYEKILCRLEQGEKEVLKDFNLQYIFTEEKAKEIGSLLHHALTVLMENSEVYVATAMCALGLFDAILLDKDDYDGYAYLNFIKQIRQEEQSGFCPKGCHTPEAVAYHEFGHLLDYMCGLSESEEFQDFYTGLTENDIMEGLSKYALTSAKEFIAEGFAEFMCNSNPRSIASKIGELMDQAYVNI